ncbi:hypothetical protein EBU58_06060 [bacterium]|nr:hypothetical protein [bacterium]
MGLGGFPERQQLITAIPQGGLLRQWSCEALLGDQACGAAAASRQAARQLLGYLAAGNSADDAIRYARHLIFLKGNDAHDYKYSSAVLEDYAHVSPAWRDRYLAAALFKMRNENEQTTSLIRRIQQALATG